MSEAQTKIPIKYKIFEKKDLLLIWEIANKEYNKSKKGKRHASIEMTINCSDGQKYMSKSDDLMKKGDIVDTKKIEALSIDFHDYTLDNRRISIDLTQGEEASFQNFVIVRGSRRWVSQTTAEIERIIEAVEKQSNWPAKFKYVIGIAGAIAIGHLVFPVIILAMQIELAKIQLASGKLYLGLTGEFGLLGILIYLAIHGFLGLLPITLLMDWTNKLIPSVEFNFGPEHTKTMKKKRIMIWTLVSIFVIPFLIGLFFHIL